MAEQVAAGRRKGKVIRCVFPDGRDEVRFAALNLKLGCLDLFEVFIDDDEKVTLGETTRVPFAAIKAAGADGNVVRISSQSGLLVETTFAQGPGPARAWADFINKARKADTSKLPQEGAGLGPQLRAAVAKQEEQVRLLEALVQRKGEQQQQLQAHLEGLLERLDLGRELFAEQEKVIRVQQAKVHRLQAAKAALAVELACEQNAMQAAAGRRAAARAGSSGPLARDADDATKSDKC
eukprot:s4842_g6.t1